MTNLENIRKQAAQIYATWGDAYDVGDLERCVELHEEYHRLTCVLEEAGEEVAR